MRFKRAILPEMERSLFRGKIIVLYGPRRVGKTTLSQEILKKYESQKKILYLSADNLTVQKNLSLQDAPLLKQFLGSAELVVIDEAQRVKNIGINLKILVDAYPEIQIIATGSSSFDLANGMKEPLTGRVREFYLAPLSMAELEKEYNQPEMETLLPQWINFGLYPEVVTGSGSEPQRVLEEITSHYLFRDILDFEGQKNSELVLQLLQLLAFQIGNEVSFTEIARILGVSKTLVEKYIRLLEQSFVIFRIGPLSRNLRNEVGKKRKIFFWDTGIRNALIQNFNNLDLRADKGPLWENFCLAERMKYLRNNFLFRNVWYWRTYQQREIDYLEEYNGLLHAYEVKWKSKKIKAPKEFIQAYPGSSFALVDQPHFWSFAKGEGLFN